MINLPRILVVDKDRDTRDFISMALADEGYEAYAAEGCRGALDLIRSFAPTLLLLDMRTSIPQSKKMVDTYRQALGNHGRIVALTTSFDPDKVAQEVNADAYLSKPFGLDDLFDVVQRYSV